MVRPVGGGALPKHVFPIETCASFDKEPDNLDVAAPCCLVQRRGMRMSSGRVVAVWILACVEQGPNNFDLTKLRCQGECEVAVCFAGCWKQTIEIGGVSQSGGYRQIDGSTVLDQSGDRFELAVRRRGMESAGGVSAVLAEEIDQRKLHATFTRYAAGGNEHECLIECGLFYARIEDDLHYMNDIGRQLAVAYGILRGECQQRGIAKIISAFEKDTLAAKSRMLPQMSAQACCISRVEQIDSAMEGWVFDPLVVGQ